MLYADGGVTPVVEAGAWVAPDASVVGDVIIAAGARVMYGARIVAESGGKIRIGKNCIVMENAVIRATARHDCVIGDHCLIGPQAHVTGATVEDEVFVATGASVFHGARLGKGSEVRINAVVHIRTVVAAGDTVPIGWVAVGDPAKILPSDQHDAIWAEQAPLNFPDWVYGLPRSTPDMMQAITARLSGELGGD